MMRWIAWTLAVLTLCPGLSASAQDPPMNVVFIMVDDLGWADSEPYGSRFYQTPQLNRLAASGVVFTNAYAANPLCSPTRASVMTGQYPGRLRFTTPAGHLPQVVLDAKMPAAGSPTEPATNGQSNTRLPNSAFTLGNLFKQSGYRTAFMGKWHLGNDPFIPENQRFDVVVGGRHHPGPPPPGHFFSPWDIDTIPAAPPGTHIADAVTDEALSFIAASAEDDEPFFLCLWPYDVHAPFQGKDELIKKYEARVDPNDPQRLPVMGAMIETMDDNVGRVLDQLEASGLADRTIVIFYSDNGGNMYDRVDGLLPTSNAPLSGGKAMSYEGGVRVPLIVRWPGLTAAGERHDALVTSPDFMPTFAKGLGMSLPEDAVVDGVDLRPALGGGQLEREAIFCHFPHYMGNPQIVGWMNRPNTTVYRGDWKLHKFYADGPDQTDRFELYNLAEDIGETNDVAAQYPALVAELTQLIAQHVADIDGLVPVANPAYDPDWTPPVLDLKPVGGWTPSANGQAKLSLGNGKLKIHATSEDPWIETHRIASKARVAEPLTLVVKMKSTANGIGEVYWGEAGAPAFAAERLASFEPVHNGQWHKVHVTFRPEKPLASLRIDPVKAAGQVEIDWIWLVNAEGEKLQTWNFND
ncbi:MAG: sulfatase [Planctomycetota bacterium]